MMDLEEGAAKQAYMQMLLDTLNKKKNILKFLMNVTEQQEELIAAESFDDSLFEQTITIKEEHLKTLTILDKGFEKLYDGIKNELMIEKYKYKDEILQLKELIIELTDISVKLQAVEKRNKTKIDFVFSQKRKAIKNSRISSRTVSNYYKNMAKQNEEQSIFYDKKK